mmetsp:Transcript_9246/g.25872  ORF Transcript_9246/g.25872 Transcript_9246/m.25872 type:complete len:205 (+) Transcript_9246:832-1446(+)
MRGFGSASPSCASGRKTWRMPCGSSLLRLAQVVVLATSPSRSPLPQRGAPVPRRRARAATPGSTGSTSSHSAQSPGWHSWRSTSWRCAVSWQPAPAAARVLPAALAVWQLVRHGRAPPSAPPTTAAAPPPQQRHGRGRPHRRPEKAAGRRPRAAGAAPCLRRPGPPVPLQAAAARPRAAMREHRRGCAAWAQSSRGTPGGSARR